MDENRIPLDDARLLVEQVMGLLGPYCQRVEIGGSIRRGKATVKDAELVIIPLPELLPALDDMVSRFELAKAVYVDKNGHASNRWGRSYRGLALPEVPDFKIELFMTDAPSWGYQFWLRTGPGDANQRIMTTIISRNAPIRFRGGECIWSRGGRWQKNGDKWQGDDEVRLNIADEETLFAVLGLPFIEPAQRNEDSYAAAFRGHQFPRDLSAYLLDQPPTPEPPSSAHQTALFDVDFVSVIDDAPKASGNGLRASVCYWLSEMDDAAAEAWRLECQRDALTSARQRLAAFDSGRVVVSSEYLAITRANVKRMERESA